jgi:hypothetical protein
MAVQSGALREGDNTVQMRNFAPGVYLEMTGSDGVRQVARVVKE